MGVGFNINDEVSYVYVHIYLIEESPTLYRRIYHRFNTYLLDMINGTAN